MSVLWLGHTHIMDKCCGIHVDNFNVSIDTSRIALNWLKKCVLPFTINAIRILTNVGFVFNLWFAYIEVCNRMMLSSGLDNKPLIYDYFVRNTTSLQPKVIRQSRSHKMRLAFCEAWIWPGRIIPHLIGTIESVWIPLSHKAYHHLVPVRCEDNKTSSSKWSRSLHSSCWSVELCGLPIFRGASLKR